MGNSLMYGEGSTGGENIPFYLLGLLQPQRVRIDNYAVRAYQTSQLTALLPDNLATLDHTKQHVMVMLEGGNSMFYGATPAQAVADLGAFVTEARSLGYSYPIGVYTVSPREAPLTQEMIDEFNTLLRAQYLSLGFDFLIDEGDAPEMAVPGSGDGTHYNSAQYEFLAIATAAALEDVL
jgi:lysophospholipase L1-like esterase